jgi:hypothetical protein
MIDFLFNKVLKIKVLVKSEHGKTKDLPLNDRYSFDQSNFGKT